LYNKRVPDRVELLILFRGDHGKSIGEVIDGETMGDVLQIITQLSGNNGKQWGTKQWGTFFRL